MILVNIRLPIFANIVYLWQNIDLLCPELLKPYLFGYFGSNSATHFGLLVPGISEYQCHLFRF